MMKNGVYFIVMAFLFAELFKILVLSSKLINKKFRVICTLSAPQSFI